MTFREKGKKVSVIAKNANKLSLNADIVYDVGADDHEYAARLFYLLRKADEDGADVVFAELPENKGIGIALYNRLYKSAGGQVILK